MCICERSGGVGGRVDIAEQRHERASGDQHQRGVDYVLAGGAEMDVPGVAFADRGPERRYEPDDRRRVLGGLAGERGGVEAVGDRCRRDRLGRLGRDQLLGRARPRERDLDVEHRLQQRLVTHLRGGCAPRVEAAQQV